MMNPYEAPQSLPDADEEAPRTNTVPTGVLVIGLGLLGLIAPGGILYGSLQSIYAMHFDRTLIPQNASPFGYLASYIVLPLTGFWFVAQLRFLFSHGERSGKGLAIVNLVFAVMMFGAVIEALAGWLGLTTPCPDLPQKTEQTYGWFFLIFIGLAAYFSLLAYGHWKMHRFYYKKDTPS